MSMKKSEIIHLRLEKGNISELKWYLSKIRRLSLTVRIGGNNSKRKFKKRHPICEENEE
jgi:hypothetical protein